MTIFIIIGIAVVVAWIIVLTVMVRNLERQMDNFVRGMFDWLRQIHYPDTNEEK